MNWLDTLILAILVITLVLGLVKGLVRQIVGLAAVIAGLVLAVVYFQEASFFLKGFISSELLRHFLGFMAVFIIVLAAGSLLGWLLGKAMIGPLKFLNHVAGGILGLLKGILIGGAVVLALLFFVNNGEENTSIRNTLMASRLAPPCYQATRAVVLLIPADFRNKISSLNEGIREGAGKYGQKI